MNSRKRLGDLLLSLGILSAKQLSYYLEKQKTMELRLGDILIQDGIISKAQLAAILEYQMKIPTVDLNKYNIDTSAVKKITEAMARRHTVIPIAYQDGKLVIAMEDPDDIVAVDDVRLITGQDIEIVMSEKSDILKMIDRYYDDSDAVEKTFQEIAAQKAVDDEEEVDIGDEEVNRSPVVRLVNSIITQAVRSRASDIHIEPSEKKVAVRIRVDGRLKEIMNPPKSSHQEIVARIKILGGMDISEKRIPQDGRIEMETMGKQIDLRISILPTVYGEKIVIRILDRSSIMLSKEQIGFTKHNLKIFNNIIKVSEGIILLTGPTGSGKTTTLYVALSELNKPDVNIITAEDPVEYRLEGVNQVQINEKAGMTFAAALRSILRQDPDIVMVGEIRDSETADMAMRAAITGHVVLSTLHTNDTVSTLSRLVDMGVEPFMVSSALVGVVAQRLVRRICNQCKEKVEISEAEQKMLGVTIGTMYRGRGCNNCNGTGYAGRIAIHEVLALDRELRSMIIDSAPADKIKEAAIKKGMLTLNESCKELILQGVTTQEEMLRVAYSIE